MIPTSLNFKPILKFKNGFSHCQYSTKSLSATQWPLLKAEMIQFFRKHKFPTDENNYSIPYPIETHSWPAFCRKETLKKSGLIPASLFRYGDYKRFSLKAEEIYNLAFEESEGHISMYFKARPFNLKFQNKSELSIISRIQTHPVRKEINFIEFSRHLPGNISTIEVPCSITGLLACPAYLKGNQVELALAKITCEVAGSNFPLPFKIDVSKLDYKAPYSAIYLSDIENDLLKDESVRFHTSYKKESTEVVWAYTPGTLPEIKLPDDWVDVNFLNRYGNPIHLTYKGYRPKQK